MGRCQRYRFARYLFWSRWPAPGLLSCGYYLQYFEGQDPCPLCLLQRGFYYAIGLTLLAGAIHGPARLGARIYSSAAFLFAAGGFGVAARQVYLQHLPPELVPACGPDLFYMLDNFPVARTLQMLVRGTGQCAEVHWRFLGLSIAEWSLRRGSRASPSSPFTSQSGNRGQGRVFPRENNSALTPISSAGERAVAAPPPRPGRSR